MNGSAGAFAARLLRASPRVYAAYAAELLTEKSRLAGHDEPLAFSFWQTQLEGRIHDLTAALDTDEPQLFLANLGWFMETQPEIRSSLAASLEALAEVLRDELPAGAGQLCQEFVEQGIAFVRSEFQLPESHLDPASAHGMIGIRYLERLLSADRDAALKILVDAFEGGLPLIDLYSKVLAPVQNELGRLWTAGELSIPQEHYASQATELAMAQFYRTRVSTPRLGKTFVASAAETDQHSLGLRMMTDLLELDGWHPIFLGADVPALEMVSALQEFRADLLTVSATLPEHVALVHKLVQRVRAEPATRSIPILVGGRAFHLAEGLWERVGADAFAQDPESGLRLARKLAGIEGPAPGASGD